MFRLILLIIFFLISLLAIIKAPEYHLWLLAIGVTEYPLLFIAIAVVLTGWGSWVVNYRVAGNWLGAITILIFLSPLLRAWLVGNGLQKDMSAAFTGNGPPPVFPARDPFSVGGLLRSTPARPYKTFAYSTYPNISLTLDFYGATSPQPSPREREQVDKVPALGGDLGEVKAAPCIIVVHGGSWSSGGSKQLPELNSYLSARGYAVAAINYRMAPDYQTPAPVEDIKQALKYLTEHAGSLHIDTNKFVLLGRSAGAQIALLAAYTLKDARLKGVVDFYGPADMVWGYSIPSNPLIMDSRKVMENYIGGSYKAVPEKFTACSPIEFVNQTSIPTLIIHGEDDPLVSPEHSRRLNLKLQQNNIRHYWLKLPWATHGFDYNINGPGGQLSTYAVETFLNTIMD